jgi:lipoprotein-releasing system permease protein
VPGVLGVTPFIYSQVMIKCSGNTSGAVLRGLDPDSAATVVAVQDMVKKGTLASLKEPIDGLPGIIIGSQLAKLIGAFPGETVKVLSPEGKLTPMGRAPNTREFRVAALFDSGMYEYDASMVYISLKEAQDFLGLGNRVTGLEVRIEDVYQSDQIAQRLQAQLGYPYYTKDWKMMNRSLFSALKLEKVTMFVILTMIVMVGALNIISTLVMVVMEKTREVAILRAMGASAKSIMSVFVVQGLLVGILGTFGGMLAGLGICHLLAKYQFIKLPADVYYISTLPVRVQMGDVWFVSLAAVVICFLATIYPAWYASKLNPVESLRYE